ncbi:MAG: undecaprenyl phosphate translocase family protein, partial [Bacillota bacterium]
STIVYVIIFGVGVVLGVVLIAKLIEKLMLTHRTLIYGFIVGLLIASPLAILVNMAREYPGEVSDSTFAIWSAGVFFMILGAYVSYYLGTKDSPEPIEELHETL